MEILLSTWLRIVKDSDDNITAIKNDKTLLACNKPMIHFEVEREYKKQINNQLTQIF